MLNVWGQRLLKFATSGDIRGVQKCLDHDCDIDHVDDDERTAISHACENGKLDITEKLILSHCDVNRVDTDGRTALSYACENGHGEIAFRLLNEDADPAIRDLRGRNALHEACAGDSPPKLIEAILNSIGVVDVVDDEGYTPLIIAAAAKSAQIPIIELLLDADADVNHCTTMCHSALALACENKEDRDDVVKLLLDAGARQILNEHRDRPIHIAVREQNLWCVKELINHKADLSQKTRHGATPLDLAEFHGFADIAELLRSAGAKGISIKPLTELRDDFNSNPGKAGSFEDYLQAFSPVASYEYAVTDGRLMDRVAQRAWTLNKGDSIHDYELVEKLGEGAFGEVWKAENANLNEVRALKFYRRTGDPASLRNEAGKVYNLLKTATNPDVRRFFVDVADTQLRSTPPYVIYEFVNGSDLADHLEQRLDSLPVRSIPFFEAAEIIGKLAEMLDVIHSLPEPLVHRDIKPHNVMVVRSKPELEMKILDFGLASYAVEESGGDSDQARQSVGGSACYISPQQRENLKKRKTVHPTHPTDDIYALGILWQQMLLGDLQDFPNLDLSDLNQFKLINQCVAQERSDRLQTGGDLFEQINQKFLKPSDEVRGHVKELIELRDSGKDWLARRLKLTKENANSWNKLAEYDLPEAQWLLGIAWENKAARTVNDQREYHVDFRHAHSWFARAAKSGFDEAQYSLGLYYRLGIHVEQNDDDAVKWFKRAAEQGHRDAQYELSLSFDRRRESVATSKTVKNALPASSGTTEAGRTQGHSDGTGTPEDREVATRYLRAAGDSGHVEAMFRCGMDALSKAKASSSVEGQQYLLEAARAGHTEAQYQLALANVDPVEWFEKAANAQHVDAQFQLGKAQLTRSEQEDAYDSWVSKRDARAWLWRAAENGHPGAIHFLRNSDDKPKDTDALRWLRKAASCGDVDSAFELASTLFRLNRDKPEAIDWLRWAAENGSADAAFLMGATFEFAGHPVVDSGLVAEVDECDSWYQIGFREKHPASQSAVVRRRRRRGNGVTAPSHRESLAIRAFVGQESTSPWSIADWASVIEEKLWPEKSGPTLAANTNVRISELARLLDVESKELIAWCKVDGFSVETHASSVTPEQRETLVAHIKNKHRMPGKRPPDVPPWPSDIPPLPPKKKC